MLKRFSRSEVKGQGHSEAKYTFPAEGYPSTSTYGRPSVVLAAEVYTDQPCDIEADKFFLSVTWSPGLGLNLGLGLKSRGHSLRLGSLVLVLVGQYWSQEIGTALTTLSAIRQI